MKSYKSTYCAVLLLFVARIFAIMLSAAIPLEIISIYKGNPVGKIILSVVLSVVIITAITLAFTALVNLVIKAFSKESVCVDRHEIHHDGKTLCLNNVKNITLFMPVIERRKWIKGQSLAIWDEQNYNITIKNPSLALIVHLKKRCTNAKFEIYELKSRIKLNIEIAIIATVLICIKAVDMF